MNRFWHWEFCVRHAVLFQLAFSGAFIFAVGWPYTWVVPVVGFVFGVVFGTNRHRQLWADTE